MCLAIKRGPNDEGATVTMRKPCQWFRMAGRATYHKPMNGAAEVKPELNEPNNE